MVFRIKEHIVEDNNYNVDPSWSQKQTFYKALPCGLAYDMPGEFEPLRVEITTDKKADPIEHLALVFLVNWKYLFLGELNVWNSDHYKGGMTFPGERQFLLPRYVD